MLAASPLLLLPLAEPVGVVAVRGEATARVMVEVLPLRPSTRAAAVFAAWFRG